MANRRFILFLQGEQHKITLRAVDMAGRRKQVHGARRYIFYSSFVLRA